MLLRDCEFAPSEAVLQHAVRSRRRSRQGAPRERGSTRICETSFAGFWPGIKGLHARRGPNLLGRKVLSPSDWTRYEKSERPLPSSIPRLRSLCRALRESLAAIRNLGTDPALNSSTSILSTAATRREPVYRGPLIRCGWTEECLAPQARMESVYGPVVLLRRSSEGVGKPPLAFKSSHHPRPPVVESARLTVRHVRFSVNCCCKRRTITRARCPLVRLSADTWVYVPAFHRIAAPVCCHTFA